MVGAAIIIDEKCHVASHLSAILIALEEESVAYGIAPWGGPPLAIVGSIEGIAALAVGIGPIGGIAVGIDTTGAEIGEGAGGFVGDGYGGTRGGIATAFEFEMEPKDEFLRGRAIDHFRALDGAATFYVAATLRIDG